jgi:hypothetical protein
MSSRRLSTTADFLKLKVVKAIRRKSNMDFNRALGIFIQHLSLLFTFISAIYKANFFSSFYILFGGGFMFFKSNRAFAMMSGVVCIIFCIQYFLSVTNINSFNNPKPFPFPYLSYPDYT